MKRFAIFLIIAFAFCARYVFAQSPEDIQQGIREAIADYWGDYLPGQPVHVHRVYEIYTYGGDPFPTPQVRLSQGPAAISVSLAGPTSNQAMQLTPSRTAFTFHYD